MLQLSGPFNPESCLVRPPKPGSLSFPVRDEGGVRGRCVPGGCIKWGAGDRKVLRDEKLPGVTVLSGETWAPEATGSDGEGKRVTGRGGGAAGRDGVQSRPEGKPGGPGSGPAGTRRGGSERGRAYLEVGPPAEHAAHDDVGRGHGPGGREAEAHVAGGAHLEAEG